MIKKYLLSNKLLSSLVILFTILQSVFTAGMALTFGKFIDFASKESVDKLDSDALILYSMLLLFYILVLNLFDYLRRYFRAGFFSSVDQAIKMEYFDNLLSVDIKEYAKRDTGHYLSRFTNDLPIVIKDYVMEFYNLLLYFFQAFFAIVVAFYINWILALIFIGLSGVIIVFTSLFEEKFSKIRSKYSAANVEFTTELKSSLGGFQDIKLSMAESNFKDSLKNEIINVNRYRAKWFNLEAIYSPGCALLTYLLTFTAIIISTILFSKGIFSVGLLTAAIYISTRIFNPISHFFEQITYMKSNRELADSIFEELGQIKAKKGRPLDTIKSYKLTDISFKYENSEEYTFKNFNFEIQKGKKYLLIGSSGAGKSTLLKIMMGLKDYEGNVMVNGEDIRDFDIKTVYSRIAYVDQSSYIFNKTIRENIDLARVYNETELDQVIEQVHLGYFNKGNRLDHLITEDVLQVSGGEKQRICLARALIKKPDVLLLDEVTASLDTKTSSGIEKTINSLNITTVYSCHKASKELFDSFDFVIDLDNKNPMIMGVQKYLEKALTFI